MNIDSINIDEILFNIFKDFDVSFNEEKEITTFHIKNIEKEIDIKSECDIAQTINLTEEKDIQFKVFKIWFLENITNNEIFIELMFNSNKIYNVEIDIDEEEMKKISFIKKNEIELKNIQHNDLINFNEEIILENESLKRFNEVIIKTIEKLKLYNDKILLKSINSDYDDFLSFLLKDKPEDYFYIYEFEELKKFADINYKNALTEKTKKFWNYLVIDVI